MNKETELLYAKLAEKRLDAKKQKLDAAGIVFAEGQLEAVEQTLYQTIFAPRDSFSNIPVSTEYNPEATSITYETATRTGVANTMHKDGDDRARADVSLARDSAVVFEGGASYDYTVGNADVAALTGFDLAKERANAAGLMIAEWHDKVALNGHDLPGVTGFANDANVATAQAAQTWTSGTTTGGKMFQDVATAINRIAEASDGAHKCNRVAMPIGVWSALAVTRFDTTSSFTVLEKLRANYPMVEFVQWSALKDEGAGSDGRIIAYERSASNMLYRATVVYDEDLPVRGNFKFNVACRGRAAGTVIRYPLAVKFQDVTLSSF